MATPVPYTGTEDISPQFEPMSQVHADTPLAAFGGAVAGAVSHLGDVAEGAGKELFARGLAFQEIDEQVKADQATADTMDAQTQRYMEFDKLRGQERIDAFPQYIKDLEQIRQQGVENLGSPYAKQKYLDESRRQQSQMIWHGGMLARQGQDEAAKIGTEAKANAAVQRFSVLSPDDQHGWDTATQQVASSMEDQVHLRGGPAPGTPEAREAAMPLISAKVGQMIQAKINSENPAAAKAFLQRAVDQKLIEPDAAGVLQQKIDYAVNFKQARRLGSQTGAGTANQNPKDVEAAARAVAAKVDPDNKALADNTAEFALARQAHEEQVQTAANRFMLQSLRQGIDGSTTDGKVPVSYEEAAQDPVWRQHFMNAPQSVKGAVLEQIRKNQTTDGWIPNQAGTDQFNHLYATLKDPRSSAQEVDEALNTDILKSQMTREQRFVIGNLQDQTINKQSSAGSINTALRMPSVQLAMQNAGLEKGTQAYSNFVTSFTQAVEAYAEGRHGTVKDNETFGKIANDMLLHQAGRMPFGLSDSDPMYKDPFAANPGLKAAAIREFKGQSGRLPTDAELSAMSGLMYRKYFQQLGQQSRPGQPKSTNRVQPKGQTQ